MLFPIRRYIYLCLPLFTLTLLSCTSPRTAPHHPITHPTKTSAADHASSFVLLLVDAKQLDYHSSTHLLRSLAKHPSTRSKAGDVGHAWIYAQGWVHGSWVAVEVGHSGESGEIQPKYLEQVVEAAGKGDPNPIRYLWKTRTDGYREKGSGGHTPTYAVRINLTQEQFETLLTFISPDHYDFHHYRLTDHQCTTFVTQVASLLSLDLKNQIKISIDSELNIGGQRLPLWSDPAYAVLPLSTPDTLEPKLREMVEIGVATEATEWYRAHVMRLPTNPVVKILYHSARGSNRTLKAVAHTPQNIKRLLLWWHLAAANNPPAEKG